MSSPQRGSCRLWRTGEGARRRRGPVQKGGAPPTGAERHHLAQRSNNPQPPRQLGVEAPDSICLDRAAPPEASTLGMQQIRRTTCAQLNDALLGARVGRHSQCTLVRVPSVWSVGAVRPQALRVRLLRVPRRSLRSGPLRRASSGDRRSCGRQPTRVVARIDSNLAGCGTACIAGGVQAVAQGFAAGQACEMKGCGTACAPCAVQAGGTWCKERSTLHIVCR